MAMTASSMSDMCNSPSDARDSLQHEAWAFEVPSDAAGTQEQQGLENYISELEVKLAIQTNLLEDTVRLHQKLEERQLALETGLNWKDAQLETLARETSEVWMRLSQDVATACREREEWRRQALRLEEENCLLRDALLERQVQDQESRRLITELRQEVLTQAHQPNRLETEEMRNTVQQLSLELKEAHQKHVLLEEKLLLSSGSDAKAGPTDEEEAPLELSLLPSQEAWGAIGLGAADRICGSSPHQVAGVERPTSIEGTGGRINVATGGCLPEIKEESLQSDSDEAPAAASDWGAQSAMEEEEEEEEVLTGRENHEKGREAKAERQEEAAAPQQQKEESSEGRQHQAEADEGKEKDVEVEQEDIHDDVKGAHGEAGSSSATPAVGGNQTVGAAAVRLEKAARPSGDGGGNASSAAAPALRLSNEVGVRETPMLPNPSPSQEVSASPGAGLGGGVERRSSWCEQVHYLQEDMAAEAPPATHFASPMPFRQRSIAEPQLRVSGFGMGMGTGSRVGSKSTTVAQIVVEQPQHGVATGSPRNYPQNERQVIIRTPSSRAEEVQLSEQTPNGNSGSSREKGQTLITVPALGLVNSGWVSRSTASSKICPGPVPVGSQSAPSSQPHLQHQPFATIPSGLSTASSQSPTPPPQARVSPPTSISITVQQSPTPQHRVPPPQTQAPLSNGGHLQQLQPPQQQHQQHQHQQQQHQQHPSHQPQPLPPHPGGSSTTTQSPTPPPRRRATLTPSSSAHPGNMVSPRPAGTAPTTTTIYCGNSSSNSMSRRSSIASAGQLPAPPQQPQQQLQHQHQQHQHSHQAPQQGQQQQQQQQQGAPQPQPALPIPSVTWRTN